MTISEKELRALANGSSKMKQRPKLADTLPVIDWELVQSKLETNEGDVEGIVHELCHAFDCIGKKAFQNPIGVQNRVAELIRAKYKKQMSSDMSEIRVTAMTAMVLQPIGFLNLEEILSNMHGNLSKKFHDVYSKEQQDTLFLGYFRRRNVVSYSNTIRRFLLETGVK